MPAKKEQEREPAAIPSTRPATFAPTAVPGEMKQVGPQKVDMTGFAGAFTKIGEPEGSEKYALMVVEDDPMGRTHHLKNQEHYWEGDEAQFKAQFEK